MTLLFFDTETTGLPNKNLPLKDARQPHIVQFAAIMTDDDGREMNSVSIIVNPQKYDEEISIPEQASAIHGITAEIAKKYGVSYLRPLTFFWEWVRSSDLIVAHNASFDMLLMKISAARYGGHPDKMDKLPVFCTMEASRNILKLPPTPRMQAVGITDYKSPKLEEAYKHFTGKELENAHDALADTRACKDVYFSMKEQGIIS